MYILIAPSLNTSIVPVPSGTVTGFSHTGIQVSPTTTSGSGSLNDDFPREVNNDCFEAVSRNTTSSGGEITTFAAQRGGCLRRSQKIHVTRRQNCNSRLSLVGTWTL